MPDKESMERSIITNYRSRLWSKFTKALKDYELIKENDKICVCISGGKDSMLLAKLFQELQRHSAVPFEAKYLVMNPGYNGENLSMIIANLERLGIPAEIRESNIFEVTSKEKGKIACYLCARMRRGALYSLARDYGCNKIALGHHFDDVIETTLLNMLNAGSFQTMLPKLRSTNFKGMELIRPMYYIREKDIVSWSEYNELKFIQCACRFTEKDDENNLETLSRRKKTKELIKILCEYNPMAEKNIFTSASNVVIDKILGCKYRGVRKNFNELYGSDSENEL